MKVQIHYQISRGATPGRLIRNPLLDLLQSVREKGSISAAAKAMGRSYRHVWGEFRRWEQELGDELLVWDKGRSARLSELGEKLLWAERQVQARLNPQIEALHADLERAFAIAFEGESHVLPILASHDHALASLRDMLGEQRPASLFLDLRFSGSADALAALNQGRCTLAGFHARTGSRAGSAAARSYQHLLRPGRHKIIGFARRTQGLMVAPGNPSQISGLAQLALGGLRFVNRPRGSGTRILLDELLLEQRVAAAAIQGYGREEPSHAGVAQAIASGAADCGLGIEHAARSFGLDFLALAEEDYFLVCRKEALNSAPVQALLAGLTSVAWRERLSGMAGYAPSDCGKVLALGRVLPWWKLAQKRRDARIG